MKRVKFHQTLYDKISVIRSNQFKSYRVLIFHNIYAILFVIHVLFSISMLQRHIERKYVKIIIE